MKRSLLLLLALFALGAMPTRAAELTPSERELKSQLGPGTPDPIPLWPGRPPRFLEIAAPEVIGENQRIRSVSLPTVMPYLPSRLIEWLKTGPKP